MSDTVRRFRTARLWVVAAELAHLRAELEAPDQLGPLLAAHVPPSWPPGAYDRDAMQFFRDRYEQEGPDAVGWYGFYAIAPGDGGDLGELVGAAGYVGPPTAHGVVEIGFSIVPEARGCGYATELARALAERALKRPNVKIVIAHAATANLASQTVLARAGFVLIGPSVADPNLLRFEQRK